MHHMYDPDLHILGITGNVGCGKSTLLRYMEEHWHARVLELDRVAEMLQKKGGTCYAPMLELLGTDVLRPDGEFDRARVAERIFADDDLLMKVNGIVHPAVKRYVCDCIGKMTGSAETSESSERPSGHNLMVIESALLYDDDYDRVCDEIWYIYTQPDILAQRLKASRGYPDEKIRAIMAAQKDDQFFRKRADAVIDNSANDPRSAYEQVDREMIRFLERWVVRK